MSSCPQCGAARASASVPCPACGEGSEEAVPRGTWNDPSSVAALPAPPPEEAEPERPDPPREAVVIPLRSSAPPPPEPVVEPGRSEALEAAVHLDPGERATSSHVERTGTHPRARRPAAEVVPLRPGDGAGPGPEQAKEPTPSLPERSAPPPRPPVLASESLRAELVPAEPGRRLARVLGATLGLLGAPAMLALPGSRLLAWWNAALLLLAAVGALLGIGYRRRALLLSAASLGGLSASGAALLSLVARSEASDAVGMGAWLLATPLLAGGLLLRAMHRASRLARGLVLLGALPVLGWQLASGGLAPRSLATLQEALSYGAQLAVAASAALSLLAFMGPHTTAAADRLAWLVLLAQGALLAALAYEGALPAALCLAVVIFSALGAVGLSEWLAWREWRAEELRRRLSAPPSAR